MGQVSENFFPLSPLASVACRQPKQTTREALRTECRLRIFSIGKKLSEDTIKKISGQCSFNGMKKNMSNYWPERTAQGPKLLRKGKIGDWKNYFSQEQNERFENEVMNKLIGTGLEFDFED